MAIRRHPSNPKLSAIPATEADWPVARHFDGENFACGFVSICDVPYPEMVESCRKTAAQMYPRHLGKGESGTGTLEAQ